ncbi:MAG: glycosyltransferase family 9 protein [Acidobacteriota bacterium]|nr:MAG: glycosyltransferase family 9 protein [Acidobacteriota bacterium]
MTRRGEGETERRRESDVSPSRDISPSPGLLVSKSPIDPASVKRILVVRLRSIGDTVLATPSLIALRRHFPQAEIDILLEDWVAPVLDGFEGVNVIAVGRSGGERLKTALKLHRCDYDLAFNLHGGTTATMFVRASGARHRVGYANYQYSFLYNHLLSSSTDFWGREKTHSAEQQLALLGYVGVPVADRPKSRLAVIDTARENIDRRLSSPVTRHSSLALLHPAAAFATKQWPVENFARIAEHLAENGIASVAIASRSEKAVLDELKGASNAPVTTFDDLSLPEVTALAAKARVFVGNDSGIAHIAAAVGTPSVVIFGSSNRDHWYPWTDAPNEIVFSEFDCQPCPGYTCEVFADPKCIKSVAFADVAAAIERLMS